MMYRLSKIILLFVLTVMLTQCAYKTVRNEYLFNTIYREYADLQPSEFQPEIERLKALAQKAHNGPEPSRVHFQLAFLYSHYRNPMPDYYRALEQLQTYVSVDPDGGREVYVQNWMGMLRAIASMGGTGQELKEKVEQLKKEISTLEKENAGMKEKLEKLRHLDIELEEKRKSVK